MSRKSTVLLSCVIALAVVGYFIGLSDPFSQTAPSGQASLLGKQNAPPATKDAKLIAAVAYSDIPKTAMGPTRIWQAKPQQLPGEEYDLFKQITPSESDKLISAQVRASRRAFNGAPPIIPHPTANTTDGACYACHSSGMQLGGKRASVMSHQFLGNCKQCHAPMAPAPFGQLDATVETTFVGLAAPKHGERAYPGAPPTIPHSRWMREKCTACHGGPNGWAGMESTHPWRTNCTQCHAPSAKFDQAMPTDPVPMLPPLNVTP